MLALMATVVNFDVREALGIADVDVVVVRNRANTVD